MVHNTSLKTQSTSLIKKPMLIGAGIGLVIISFFVMITKDPRPEWGKLWMIRPLIITPAAGFVGGAFYYLITQLSEKKLHKVIAVILGVIAFMFSLWIGTILGLDGTLWD